MVTNIPKGVFTMKKKFAIIKHNAKFYKKATKKVKSQMINELAMMFHMNKQYISYLLRNAGKVITRRGRVVVVADLSLKGVSLRGRKRVYGEDVLKALKYIWPLTGYASSKHLVVFIRFNHEILFNDSKIKDSLSEKTKDLLLKVSSVTVDRLLKSYKDKLKLKNKYRSNPFSSKLKKFIMVKSWFDKPKQPGYVEIDLVHHSGASGKGDFIYTLTATEISIGWIELIALKNKAMIWTTKSLEDIIKAMPVPIKRLHSDNGSEFINAHVQRFCKEKEIVFCRSRPYKKNDAPYVESKNWSIVRAYVGWRKYDTEEELRILDRLLKAITIRHNLFMPHMRLARRKREGGKVIRQYER